MTNTLSLVYPELLRGYQNLKKANDDFDASTYKTLEKTADKATEELNTYLEPPKALPDRGRGSGGERRSTN
jgi:hypothetical protein